MKRSVRRSLERIRRQFDEIETLVPLAERRAKSVSGWSVGHHVDHMLKVDRSVVHRFEKPESGPLPPIKPGGWLILTLGWIPRGRAQAPAHVLPEVRPAAELAADLAAVRELVLRTLSDERRLADPRPIARHPVFGGLAAARWVRFVAVHHGHHLKIARDVARASG